MCIPTSLYAIIQKSCDYHDIESKQLVFDEEQLYRLCEDQTKTSVQTCSKTDRKRILFAELTNEYDIVGLCGQCSLIAEYLLQRNEISQKLFESLQKDANTLPFGLYFCTSKSEYPALCILWNPNDTTEFESKALVLLRILCQQTSAIWVFDNTNIETLKAVATTKTEVKRSRTVMKQGTLKLRPGYYSK